MMRFEEKTGIKVCYGIDILSGHVIFETWLQGSD